MRHQNNKRHDGPKKAMILLAIVWTATWIPAHAEAETQVTTWQCWYNRDTQIQCVPKETHFPPSSERDGTRGTLWATSVADDGEPVFIPLFTHPEDWSQVRLLAESVMCGTNFATCRVEFHRSLADVLRSDPRLSAR